MLPFVREEQYRQVWAELETFLEAASKTSKMHEKVTHLHIFFGECHTFLFMIVLRIWSSIKTNPFLIILYDTVRNLTGLKGRSWFCFPCLLDIPLGEAERNTEDRGETKLTVPRRGSH